MSEERRYASVAIRVGTAFLAVAGPVWAACGGNAGGSENHSKPTATRTVNPESTATRGPEVTKTAAEPKSLLDAVLPSQPLTANEVTSAIDKLYHDHPEAENFQGFPRSYADNNWQICQFGDPADAGKPESLVEDKVTSCFTLLQELMGFYARTGSEDYYILAVKIYSFALGEIPANRHQELNNLLKSAGLK